LLNSGQLIEQKKLEIRDVVKVEGYYFGCDSEDIEMEMEIHPRVLEAV